MTRENIIRMAQEAKFYVKDDEAYSPSNQEDHELTEHLEAFAALVLANNPPQSSMAWQEGFEAGRTLAKRGL